MYSPEEKPDGHSYGNMQHPAAWLPLPNTLPTAFNIPAGPYPACPGWDSGLVCPPVSADWHSQGLPVLVLPPRVEPGKSSPNPVPFLPSPTFPGPSGALQASPDETTDRSPGLSPPPDQQPPAAGGLEAPGTIDWWHMLTLEPMWSNHIIEMLSFASGQPLSPILEPSLSSSSSSKSLQTDGKIAAVLQSTWAGLESPRAPCDSSPGGRLSAIRRAHDDLQYQLHCHEQHCWREMRAGWSLGHQIEMLGAVMNLAPLRSFLTRLTLQAVQTVVTSKGATSRKPKSSAKSTSSSGGGGCKRKAVEGFPKEIIELLNQWYNLHRLRPYFRGGEKDALVRACRDHGPISRDQVAKWMINKRHRVNLKDKQSDNLKDKQFDNLKDEQFDNLKDEQFDNLLKDEQFDNMKDKQFDNLLKDEQPEGPAKNSSNLKGKGKKIVNCDAAKEDNCEHDLTTQEYS